jgi:uncharacterized membrane protein YdjX (TVP38/TMEM64 family)
LILGLLIIGFLVGSRFFPMDRWIGVFIGWMEQLGGAGKLMFTGVYVVAMVACIWGTPLTLAAGVAFGVWWGTIVATAGATGGSAAAFLIARYLARGWVAKWMEKHKKFKAIDAAIGQSGWKVVFLTRFSPIIPFSFSNYLFGVTRVSFWAFFWASLLAIFPGSFVIVYLGHIGRLSIAGGFEELDAVTYGLLTAALLMTLGVVFYFGYTARKALANLEEEEKTGGRVNR